MSLSFKDYQQLIVESQIREADIQASRDTFASSVYQTLLSSLSFSSGAAKEVAEEAKNIFRYQIESERRFRQIIERVYLVKEAP